ncbi:MAG: hypothetical protein KF713_13840 [Turneriella sp.]|nr:hypothetical protein [Turneriella sp.]
MITLPLAAADFGKLDTAWDRLTPKAGPEKWNFGSEGFITYTLNTGPYFPARHSYAWLQFYGNYQVVPHYNISALATVQKRSMSSNLTDEPFSLRAFPQLSFEGTLLQALPFDFMPGSGHTLRVQAGTLPMFRHGQGLFYSQFTGVGFQAQIDFTYFSIEAALLGYGYFEGDDVQSFYIYSPKKWFGIGALSEINAPAGNRIVPGIAGEVLPFPSLRLYYEAGVSFLYQQRGAALYYTGESYGGVPRYIDLTNVSFGRGFQLNERTVSGLVGVDYARTKFWGIFDRLLLSNQVRYYGAEATDFYEKQRRSHFYYFTDLTTDQRYNNQPYNFYLFPGRSFGLYFLQEVDVSPWQALRVTLRNELLLVFYENGYAGRGYNPVRSGNDLLSVVVSATVEEKVFLGIKVSNVLIGDIEYGSQEALTYQRAPLLLEAARYWLLDFHARYRI